MSGPLNLEPIKERLANVPPGPWYAVLGGGWYEDEGKVPDDAPWTVSTVPDKEGWNTDCGWRGYGLPKTMALFLAEARTDIPALIDEVERLRAALKSVWPFLPEKPDTVDLERAARFRYWVEEYPDQENDYWNTPEDREYASLADEVVERWKEAKDTIALVEQLLPD